jgi:UPF0716 protein FxsA
MTRFIPLLFLAAVAAEISSIIWVGGHIGVMPTLLLLLLGLVIGTRLVKSAGTSVAAALRSPVRTAAPLRGVGGQAAAHAVSGLLFLLPGFFSDIMALLLFLPPVRRWLGSKFRVETYPQGGMDDRRFDRVIEAEAVEITSSAEPPGRGS